MALAFLEDLQNAHREYLVLAAELRFMVEAGMPASHPEFDATLDRMSILAEYLDYTPVPA